MKRLLRTLILLLVRGWGLLTARRVMWPRTAQPLRILLVRPDHLGDLILVTPVLQALRDRLPDAHITMMVGPWSQVIVERHPALDHVLQCSFPGFQRGAQNPLAPYRQLWQMARQLRREHYDLAINLRPDFWWGAALLYLAGIPWRIGYAIEPGRPFLTHALPFPSREHATVSNLRLISASLQVIGNSPLEEPYTPMHYPLQFQPTDEEKAWVIERLRSSDIDAAIIVIHAGTGGAVKLWRSNAWSTVANQLASSPNPVHIVLTGSPKERPLLEEIQQGLEENALLITDASVGQLAALLARAQVVVGVDSGPLHLATAQDTPTLRLFGPTDTHIFRPWGIPERHRVIISGLRCASCPAIPCGRLDFRQEELADHPCVRLISEAEVIREIGVLRDQYLPF